jgi:hypothetical protein
MKMESIDTQQRIQADDQTVIAKCVDGLQIAIHRLKKVKIYTWKTK